MSRESQKLIALLFDKWYEAEMEKANKTIAVMKCYDKHSKLLAIILCSGISGITWHEDGMYIYWQAYNEYDETWERQGCIICDYTITDSLSPAEFRGYLKASRVPVIKGNEVITDYTADTITIK